MSKIRWGGVLSRAKIGLEKAIPAMKQGQYSEIATIISRDFTQAKRAAPLLEIPKAYGSYKDLLSDIDAVYIPLPNHMHVEWQLKP